jgi:acetoacetyl-CoA synthetase
MTCCTSRGSDTAPPSLSRVDMHDRGGDGWAVSRHNPYTETLTGIWQRVLDRSPITANDNFFALGGDSILAVALFLAIEEATGRTLPVTTIYDAPTVAALAAALQRDAPADTSPLVLLASGDVEPPLFVVGGVGGGVMYLSRLARNLTSGHAVYGLKARGLDGPDPPDDRVDEMAEHYLDAVQARQPHGPYLLAGHSFGGLVMLEVARRLLGRGEKIALLALIDAYPHPRFWPLIPWVAGIGRLLVQHVATLRGQDGPEVQPYLAQSFRNLLDFVRVRYWNADDVGSDAAYVHLPQKMRSVAVGHRRALRRYRPRYYPGKVTFLRAGIARGLCPADAVSVWGRLTELVAVHTVRGDHIGMVIEDPVEAAEHLSRCIDAGLTEVAAGAVPRSPGPGGTGATSLPSAGSGWHGQTADRTRAS